LSFLDKEVSQVRFRLVTLLSMCVTMSIFLGLNLRKYEAMMGEEVFMASSIKGIGTCYGFPFICHNKAFGLLVDGCFYNFIVMALCTLFVALLSERIAGAPRREATDDRQGQ
jgi:hypothetical protein